MTKRSPFRYFKTSPEIIRLAVIMYVRFPLSLRNVEVLLQERGIDISYETVRFWWNRFGPLFSAEIRKKGVVARRVNWPERALPETDCRRCVRNCACQVRSSGPESGRQSWPLSTPAAGMLMPHETTVTDGVATMPHAGVPATTPICSVF
jgi:hypothetical protein